MPGGYPLGLDVANGNSLGANPASFFAGTDITPGTSSTKGSWTTIGSFTNDVCWLQIMTLISAGTDSFNFSVDVGVGPSSSPTLLASNLMINVGQPNTTNLAWYNFPCQIPASENICARGQISGTDTAGAFQLFLQGFDGAYTQMEGSAVVDSLGFVSSNTLGTPVVPGNATKGTFTTISSATARDYIGVLVTVDPQNNGNNYSGFEGQLLDIGIGSSGNEKVIVPDYFYTIGTFTFISPTSDFYSVNIPAGSRLSARIADPIGSTVAIGVTLYGVSL